MEFADKNDDTINTGEESQEERIQFLRDRGVKIEFPEDRKGPKASSNVQRFEDKIHRLVKLVKIPCNLNSEYEEFEIIVNKEAYQCDPYTDSLKDQFTKNVDEKMIKNLVSTMGSSGISKETLMRLALEGQAESFPISRPVDNNKNQAVNFYVDELGQSKGLDLNTRAAALANFCGFKSVPILGDVLVGRYELIQKSNGGKAYNPIDFMKSELDSSADWAKNCEHNNYEWGISTGQISMDPNAMRANNSKATIIPLNGEDRYSVNDEDRYSVNDDEAVQIDSTQIPGLEWTEADDSMEVNVDLKYLAECVGTNTIIKWDKKSIDVKITSKLFKISIIGIDGAVLEVPLAGNISPDDSTWTLSGGGTIIELSLEKSQEGLVWNRLRKVD